MVLIISSNGHGKFQLPATTTAISSTTGNDTASMTSSDGSLGACSASSYEAGGHSLTKEEIGRFSRQLILQGFGPKAQDRLKSSSVLIVGAGGLGCPVSIYLAGAGVGRIGLVDHDAVSLDNIHRQVAHDEASVGHPKAESLKQSILRLNSGTRVDTYQALLTSQNAFEIVQGYDVVADCSDNVATRYLINDACVLVGKPLVSGSALGWEGQLTVYNNGPKCPCYRCIFPTPPSPDTVTNCSDAGVLGPIVGMIGSLQALEVMKILVRGESSFAGSLWLFDGVDGRTRTISLREKMPSCAVCGKNPTVRELQDYTLFCGAGPVDRKEPLSVLKPDERVSVREYAEVRHQSGGDRPPLLIDTRPAAEFDICHLPEAKNIPLEEMKKLDASALLRRVGYEQPPSNSHNSNNNGSAETVYVVCHRGNDSQLAVELLRSKFPDSKGANHSGGNNNSGGGKDENVTFRDLAGGLEAWAAEVDESFPRY
jgi:adenylyltransferase/sulfurtransferase